MTGISLARRAVLARVAATLVAFIVLGWQEVGAQAPASTPSPLQPEPPALSTTHFWPYEGGPAGAGADDPAASWAENAALKERVKRLEKEQRATRDLVEQLHAAAQLLTPGHGLTAAFRVVGPVSFRKHVNTIARTMP